VELLRGIPIEIADEQTDTAVFVEVPAFERAGDARSALADALGERIRRRRLSDALLRGRGHSACECGCRRGEDQSSHLSAPALPSASAHLGSRLWLWIRRRCSR